MDENRRGGSEGHKDAGSVRKSGQVRKRTAGSAAERDGQARKRNAGSTAGRNGQAQKRNTGSTAERERQVRKRSAGSAADRDREARKRSAGSTAERERQVRKRSAGNAADRDREARKRSAGSTAERDRQARKRSAGSTAERDRQARKRTAGSTTERDRQARKRSAGSAAERDRQARKRSAGSIAERDRQARKRSAGSTAERDRQARKRRPDGIGRRDHRQREELLRIAREQQLNRRLIMAACGAGVFLLIFAVILLVRRGSGQNAGGKKGAERTESVRTVSGEETAPVPGTLSEAESFGEQAPAAAQAAPQLALTEDGQDYYFGSDPSYTQKITILGTGDNIIHEALYQNAATGDGGYDFTPYYRLVKPYIEEADIATVNQEAPLASRLFSVSGYPHFNSPVQVADALMDAGFDMLNLANNHILDQGESGLVASLEYLSEKGYPYCGAYFDEEDRDTPHIIERNGIKVAFVGFVDWTNVDPVSEVSGQLIWNSDEEMVKRAIENAKAAADIVVVHVHWGEENEEPLTEAMTYLSQKMVDWGADLILGNHTHVVQKMRVLRRESDGKLVPVQYGGGNFLSGQKERAHLLSILTTAEFAKNPQTGDVICTGLHCRPVVTHYIGDRKDACVYPLADYTDELAAENGVKDFENEPMTTEYLWGLLHDEIPDQFLIS